MHEQESVMKNETCKFPWDFEIQTDHLISARRPDLMIINNKKRICRIVDLAFPVNHSTNLKERKKKDKDLDLTRDLIKTLEHEMTIMHIITGVIGSDTKGLVQGLEDLQITRRVESIQCTTLLNRTAYCEESWRLVVTHTSVKDNQLTVVWKTLKEQSNKGHGKEMETSREKLTLFWLQHTGWNDKIVVLEKTTWFHFRLMKTVFFFVADHFVGQLCTNPKIGRSLLSCLKATQCSTSEIGDGPLFNSCSLPVQVMTTGSLPAPSKWKSLDCHEYQRRDQGDENKVSGHGYSLWCGFK